MNRFTFRRKYIFILLMMNFFNASVLSDQSNCLNYPYPEGIYIKNKSNNKKQLIYTKSVSIKNKDIRKIEFVKKKNNLYAITSLSKYIEMYFPNLKEEEIGIYNIYSCFDSNGIYKISYAHRDISLKNLTIFQKVKKFIDKKFFND